MAKKFISISRYPGKQGYSFYSKFFEKYKIDASYTPIGTLSLLPEITTQLKNDVQGISISMPFKKEVIQLLDSADDTVVEYSSCNTIVVTDHKMHGYNTDLYGVIYSSSKIKNNSKVSILGNGCMGKMFSSYLNKHTNSEVTIYSPSLGNWGLINTKTDVIINCTPYGTANSDSPYRVLPTGTSMIIDLALNVGVLNQQATVVGSDYISGQEFYKHQFMKQFEIYTGISLDAYEL